MSNDDPAGRPPTEGWQPPAPPPPPPYGQQAPPYGSPGPGYGPPYGYGGYPPQTEGTAIGALIAAIGSWVVCPISGIVALVLASQAKRKIASSGGRLTGQGLVTASKWIAWINIGLWVAGLLFFLVVMLLAAFSQPTGDADFQRLMVVGD